jgi:hypothetical protein
MMSTGPVRGMRRDPSRRKLKPRIIPAAATQYQKTYQA